MKSQKTIPYGALERDLCRLIADRVSDAMASVMQLAETPEVGFALALSANQVTRGMMAGTYDVMHGSPPGATDAVELERAFDDIRKAMLAEDRP